jgi:hypothetical protein
VKGGSLVGFLVFFLNIIYIILLYYIIYYGLYGLGFKNVGFMEVTVHIHYRYWAAG